MYKTFLCHCKATIFRNANMINFTLIFRSVSIEKCRHTTIVLGAVETSIQMNNCEHVTVIAASRHFAARYSNHLFIATSL